ncbi:MAG: clostripain-related cysteine peptidase [Elusimicrobia bacterium]|nr:clostripain-related cysteine peptidase [Elusimicrobiota bacterium]
MFKKLVAVFAMIAIVSPLVSAEINFDTPKKTTLQQEIADLELSVPVAAPVDVKAHSGKVDKEWTIMVFINAKNNLEKYGLMDMNEMEMIGSTDKVNVVTELGRMSGYDSSDGNWVGSRRYLVVKDANMSKIASPVVQDLGKVDMGDYKHLIDFATWAKKNYPAKRYMLVVWNHGAGWIKSRGLEVKGISYDDETGNHINTPQLGMALKGIGKIDVYGSDACLMQMPEVNYEIKDYVDYIVGSEETEPGDGYTYNMLLGPLVAKPTMLGAELGKLAVDAYSDHYGTQDHTQSLVLASAMNGLVPVINDFVAAAIAANEKPLIKTAMGSAQSYAYAENKDLWHFLSLYSASSQNANVKAAAKALQDYLTGKLILHNRVNSTYADSHGLAIYLPDSPNSAYNDLAWAKASQWDEFINWYTK